MNLTGKCLVARPSIQDNVFKKSVVFIFEHTKEASAGLILNKHRRNMTTHDLCLSRGFNPQCPKEQLWHGGPVNENSVVMLHSTDWRSSNTLLVNDHFSVTSDDNMLHKYVNGDTPRGYKFFAGSSMWHSQQMKAEMSRLNWIVTTLDFQTIFESDHRNLWDLAVESAAHELMDRYL